MQMLRAIYRSIYNPRDSCCYLGLVTFKETTTSRLLFRSFRGKISLAKSSTWHLLNQSMSKDVCDPLRKRTLAVAGSKTCEWVSTSLSISVKAVEKRMDAWFCVALSIFSYFSTVRTETNFAERPKIGRWQFFFFCGNWDTLIIHS